MSGAGPGTRRASDVPLPGGSFRLFVTRLSFQAMMSLGMIENPLTHERAKNLPHARALLDDLEMLLEKTSGNLTPDEHGHLEKIIADMSHALERLGAEPEDDDAESEASADDEPRA